MWRVVGIRNKQNYQSGLEQKKIKSKVYYLKKMNFKKRLSVARKESTQYFLKNSKEIATRKSSEIVLSHIMKTRIKLIRWLC